MIGESFDLQIYMAYLEYKLWCGRNNMYVCTFDTFRRIGLESAQDVHCWLNGGSNDNRANAS